MDVLPGGRKWVVIFLLSCQNKGRRMDFRCNGKNMPDFLFQKEERDQYGEKMVERGGDLSDLSAQLL